MDDLVAFLAARLDEDEAAADGLQFACRYPGKVPDFTWCGGPAAEAYWRHFDPARALREAEAWRALLRMHEPVPFWGNNPPPLKDRTPENAVAWYCECQCPDGMIQGAYPCVTARLLAAVYSDHPDCRPQWKP